jgi:A/G-specific adenine glycosylase
VPEVRSQALTLLDADTQKQFLQRLLRWYKKHGRHDMPWRKTKDPYAIFLSEIMLQQTTVATVGPYYDRFLKKFPTVRALAQANLNDVLALWSGLGYYARARNLWSAAKELQTEWRGKFPTTPEQLQKLSGVGPYTAGAVAAFAFDQPASVLDGNIIRVLMRILAIEDDPKMKAVLVVLRSVSLALSKGTGGSRHINLALMDLGSTVCIPQNPRCDVCPVADLCLARKAGRQNAIPLKGDTPERPVVRRLYAALEWEGKWLLGQRPKEGLFGGLWEFVGFDAPSGVEPIQYLEDAVQKEIGFEVQVKRALPAFEHQLTHRIFLVRSFVCEPQTTGPDLLPKKTARYDKLKWMDLSKRMPVGISAITQRIRAELTRA